jgi:4-amino-4-deoxy-L-arabinose transferase-like glycosyltransferase
MRSAVTDRGSGGIRSDELPLNVIPLWRDRWVIGAVVFGLLIRLTGLDGAPLWFDEVDTAAWAALSPEQLFDGVVRRIPSGRYDPTQMPLYFLVVNAWTTVAGLSPWSLRFPGVVFSVGTVALSGAVAGILIDRYAARWAAWLSAISPYLLHHAQDARMYGLVSLLAAASMLILVRFLRGDSPRLGLGFVIVNVALLATHYYGFFLIGGELLILVIFRRPPWRTWLPGALGSIVAAMSLLYVALRFTPHQSGELYAIGLLAFPGVMWSMLSGYTLLPSSEELHGSGLQAIRPYVPFALLAIIPVAVVTIAGIRMMHSKARVMILIILVCIALGPFLAHILFPKVSVNPRYFMTGFPALVVLLAAGMPRRFDSRAHWICSLALIAIMVIGSARHLLQPDQKREDVLAAGRWLDKNVPNDAEILVTSDEMATLAYYFWPNRRFVPYPPRNVVADVRNAGALAEALPFNDSGQAIYIVGRAWVSDPDRALQNAISNRYRQCSGTEVRGVHIYCLRKPPIP